MEFYPAANRNSSPLHWTNKRSLHSLPTQYITWKNNQLNMQLGWRSNILTRVRSVSHSAECRMNVYVGTCCVNGKTLNLWSLVTSLGGTIFSTGPSYFCIFPRSIVSHCKKGPDDTRCVGNLFAAHRRCSVLRSQQRARNSVDSFLRRRRRHKSDIN